MSPPASPTLRGSTSASTSASGGKCISTARPGRSGEKHGATNANVKRYIDFAAKNGFGGVLVEGWNRGWDGDWIANGKHFSFTESYPDFDLPQLSAYARERGVRLIGHNETAGAVENYERQLDAAMALYEANGVSVVKTGYVKPSGSIERTLADGTMGHEWFAGQYRVGHELKVAEVAATTPHLDRSRTSPSRTRACGAPGLTC